MRSSSHYFVFLLFLLLGLGRSNANCQNKPLLKDFFQTSQLPDALGKLHIDSIIISGNSHTKNYIIRREMRFKQGDSIEFRTIIHELETERQHIYNTALFVEVSVMPDIISAYNCKIIVSVKERWYIFPIPKFQLVDRSFNEWIDKHNGSLDRVNYGVNFLHNNLTGRKDKLRVTLITGYTQNISGSYTPSYSNHKLTRGYSIGAGYMQMREIPYLTTYQNQLLLYKQDTFVSSNWYVNLSYTIRKAIKKKETFRIRFTQLSVTDSIIQYLNPSYYNSKLLQKEIPEVSYQLNYDDVDNILYPLRGWSGRVFILKRGFMLKGGINMFNVQGLYDQYFSFGRKWFGGFHLQGEVKLPFEQSYINQRALGYEENYIRGLELYVIDGVVDVLSKFNLKKEIIHFTVPGFRKSGIYNHIPFTIYAKTFSDMGYVYNKKRFSGMLNNTFLYSGGFGFDIVTLYDLHLRLEYSFNQLGENGLFLHNGAGL